MKKFLSQLLELPEALSIVSEKIGIISRKIKMPTWKSIGYVSARTVVSPIDYPMTNRSGFDGYAVRHTDTPGKLRVVRDFHGEKWNYKLKKGEAVVISTGEYLPVNADTVVPLEAVKKYKNHIIVGRFAPYTNVDKAGSLIRKGEILLRKGSVITPFHTTGLLELGIERLSVYSKIKTRILVVGDNLVEPRKYLFEKRVKSERIETSSHILKWLIKKYSPWVSIKSIKLISSQPEKLIDEINKNTQSTDLYILIGSVGPGEKDVCIDTLETLQSSILFRGLALKGGRPTTLAMLDGKPIFWLPGQPNSVFSVFLHFLYPALKILGGVKRSWAFPIVKAKIAGGYGGGMARILYVVLKRKGKNLFAYPLEKKFQKSSSTVTLMLADGAAILGKEKIDEGEEIPVFLLKEKILYLT